MARTKAKDFDDKLRLILDTAAQVFAEKGFNVATTTDIAKACGMSKSALYHYHRSKEAILYAMLHTHLHEVIADVRQAVEGVSGAEPRLHAFLLSLMQSNAVSRSKNIVLLNAADDLPTHQRAEIRRLERRLVQMVMELIEPLNPGVMQSATLRKPYAMFLFGLVNWTYTWYEPRGPIQPAEIARRLCDLFLHGFPAVSAADQTERRPRARSAVTLGVRQS